MALFAHDRLIRVLRGENRGLAASLLRAALACVEPVYKAVIRARNVSYNRGWRAVHRANVPVISVGNLTTGGTGKTPLVMHIVERLRESGRRPAVLLRGYRGERAAPEDSDERRLLAERLPGVPVVARADRVAAARSLLVERPEVDVIVLDDGFQHRRLHRDLDLVVIDAARPFGFGHVLPRGLLREPLDALRRADGVLITRADRLDEDARRALAERIQRWHARPPIAWFSHEWEGLLDERNRAITPGERPRVLAFCGIGNPEAFLEQANEGMQVAATRIFPDHHAYTAADLDSLIHSARTCHANALLTTEKDWVKVRGLLHLVNVLLPIWRPRLRMNPIEGGSTLDHLLMKDRNRV